MIYENGNGGEYGKYFVQTLQCPPNMGTPEYQELYRKFSHRILWMDMTGLRSRICWLIWRW